MNDDPVLILNGEVWLDENKEFGINHDISNAHFLVYSLITKDQLDINRWQLIGLPGLPLVDYCDFSGNRIIINPSIS